jgi:hypothetical protein
MTLGPTRRPPAAALRTASAVALAAAAAAVLGARLARSLAPPNVHLADPDGPPTIDASGRARSVQAADLEIDPARLAPLFSTAGLHRLAETYLRFLPRATLGLIRVVRTPDAQLVVLLARPAVLLAFDRPELRLRGPDHGRITWPIRGGLLATPGPGRPPAAGALRIDVHRLQRTPSHPATLRIEVAVLDFPPMLASRFGPAFYAATQARIHVVVTHTFLRSLARMRLAPPAA